jgi:phosphatidylglycerophosphate synthase
MDATAPPANRRPLRSRQSGWAQAAAARLARIGIAPNRISRAAVIFAALGGAALAASGLLEGGARVGVLIAAALAVQLRLLCNLFDGLVAVEHGRASPSGAIWNELPDRIADGFFFVGAGYGAALAGVGWGEAAGWAATVFAVMTAYVRELGRGLGQPADFCGPMAKPQRMAVLTLAALAAAAEPLWGWRGETLAWAAAMIAAGSAFTVARRTFRLSRRLKGT